MNGPTEGSRKTQYDLINKDRIRGDLPREPYCVSYVKPEASPPHTTWIRSQL